MAKPSLPRLRTPKTATFPSEITQSPISSVVENIKQEEGTQTPITPPVAYTDFLKALTPVLASPISAGVFTFTELPSGKTTPTSEPSTSSSFSSSSEDVKSPATSVATSVAPTPTSAGPNSMFAPPPRRMSKGPATLRRLRIPLTSPVCSPGTDTPSSIVTSARSPFSPADWSLDQLRYLESPRSAVVRPVTVRSVVTRTVTYKRTPLDPAPKGKKRKIEEEESSSSLSSSTSVTPTPTVA